MELENTSTQEASNQGDLLLDEYTVSMEYAKHLSSIMWQTASIFLNLSLVGIAYFAGTRAQNIKDLISKMIVAVGSIAMLLVWYSLFRRWDSYSAVGFYRMAEIEEVLGLWLVRYGGYLREWRLSGKIPEVSDEAKERLERLRQNSRLNRFFPHSQERMVTLIVMLLIAGWGILVMLDIISVFF